LSPFRTGCQGWPEVYTGPGPGRYAVREDFEPGQDVPVVIDGVELGRIADADMLA